MRLLQRILAHVQAVAHIEVDADAWMADLLHQAREDTGLVPAHVLQSQCHTGACGLVRDRRQLLAVHADVLWHILGVLASGQQDRVRTESPGELDKRADMLQDLGAFLWRERREVSKMP